MFALPIFHIILVFKINACLYNEPLRDGTNKKTALPETGPVFKTGVFAGCCFACTICTSRTFYVLSDQMHTVAVLLLSCTVFVLVSFGLKCVFMCFESFLPVLAVGSRQVTGSKGTEGQVMLQTGQ